MFTKILMLNIHVKKQHFKCKSDRIYEIKFSILIRIFNDEKSLILHDRKRWIESLEIKINHLNDGD